jgi:hypothetical protein
MEVQLSNVRHPALTLDGTDTSRTVKVPIHGQLVVSECVSSTSLVVTPTAQFVEDGTYRNVPYFVSDAGVFIRKEAGDSFTLAAGDILYVPCPGAYQVKLSRGSGSGSATLNAVAADASFLQILTDQASNLDNIVNGAASNTDGTSTSCIASSGSGVKTYLTDIVLVNTSASGVLVEIKDGSTTKAYVYVPATQTAGMTLTTPLEGTAATAWNFDPGAATTTVYCTMSGFKSKV